jgi:hypothetical protein
VPSEDKVHTQAAPLLDLSKLPIQEPEEGIFSVYSNLVNFDWTLFDVRLRFAELIQVPDESNPVWSNQQNVILERAAITIPWHQAKAISSMLAGLVQNYEALNGELKHPQLPNSPQGAPTSTP